MNWNELNLSDRIGYLYEPPYCYAAIAAIALTFLFILLKRRQPKKVIAYKTENGQVTVSRSAIVELVQTSCQQLSYVSKPRVKIKVKGKTTHFEVRLKLTSGASLRKIESTLQAHLRRALTEDLGIENLGRIDILATGFKSGKISELPRQSQIAVDEPEYSENDDLEILDSSEDDSAPDDSMRPRT